jgi:hypothetical protein
MDKAARRLNLAHMSKAQREVVHALVENYGCTGISQVGGVGGSRGLAREACAAACQ